MTSRVNINKTRPMWNTKQSLSLKMNHWSQSAPDIKILSLGNPSLVKKQKRKTQNCIMTKTVVNARYRGEIQLLMNSPCVYMLSLTRWLTRMRLITCQPFLLLKFFFFYGGLKALQDSVFLLDIGVSFAKEIVIFVNRMLHHFVCLFFFISCSFKSIWVVLGRKLQVAWIWISLEISF